MKMIRNHHTSIAKIRFLSLCFLLCTATLYFPSCKDREQNIENNAYSKLLNSKAGNTHRWFYFTDNGFLETQKPSQAPSRTFSPWTETPRITAGALIQGTVFFAVNKLGILVCPATSGFQPNGISSKTYLVKNPDLFLKHSTGDIYCINEKPVCSFYTNNIFDIPEKTIQENLDFKDAILVQFDNTTNTFNTLFYSDTFYPSDKEAEYSNVRLSSLQYVDTNWYAAFKSSTDNKTTFLFTKTTEDTTETSSNSMQISQDAFRTAIKPLSYSKAPEKIHNLLYMIPKSTSFYLRYIQDSMTSTVIYSQSKNDTVALEGCAMTLPNCSVAVFSDGTTYFAGTLPFKHVLKNGNTIAFKLPKLPSGYLYGNALLSGSNLYVSWEQTDFYKTGKSGYIVVDLEKVLYTGEIE